MSSLSALSSFQIKHDLVQKIIKDYTGLTNSGKRIVPCWIPSHVNIPGSKRADTAAKLALCLPITSMKLPACDIIPRVSRFCLKELQDIWNKCMENKRHSIYPTIRTALRSKTLSRCEAVILNRLRIGALKQ